MAFSSFGGSGSLLPKPQKLSPVFGATSVLGSRPTVDWSKSTTPVKSAENEGILRYGTENASENVTPDSRSQLPTFGPAFWQKTGTFSQASLSALRENIKRKLSDLGLDRGSEGGTSAVGDARAEFLTKACTLPLEGGELRSTAKVVLMLEGMSSLRARELGEWLEEEATRQRNIAAADSLPTTNTCYRLSQRGRAKLQYRLAELECNKGNFDTPLLAEVFEEMLGQGQTVETIVDILVENLDESDQSASAFANWLCDFLFQISHLHDIDAVEFFKPKPQRTPTQKPSRTHSRQTKATNDPQKAKSDTTGLPETFRLLDLPAELRQWVYKVALAPTGVWIRSRGHKCDDYFVSYGYGLLSTCRQINNEIGDLLYSRNTFYLDADNVDTCVLSVFKKHKFNNETYPLLQHIVLTLNIGDSSTVAEKMDGFRRCDWRQLQRMTDLKTARIMIIRSEFMWEEEWSTEMLLGQVIERLPAKCAIDFGPKTELDRIHAEDWAANTGSDHHREYYGLGRIVVSNAEKLKEAAERMTLVKGCKSGSELDYRWG